MNWIPILNILIEITCTKLLPLLVLFSIVARTTADDIGRIMKDPRLEQITNLLDKDEHRFKHESSYIYSFQDLITRAPSVKSEIIIWLNELVANLKALKFSNTEAGRYAATKDVVSIFKQLKEMDGNNDGVYQILNNLDKKTQTTLLSWLYEFDTKHFEPVLDELDSSEPDDAKDYNRKTAIEFVNSVMEPIKSDIPVSGEYQISISWDFFMHMQKKITPLKRKQLASLKGY